MTRSIYTHENVKKQGVFHNDKVKKDNRLGVLGTDFWVGRQTTQT